MSNTEVQTSFSTGDAPRTHTPSQQFSFEDGNIVLEAEGILFRIHRSIMGKHSIVFKDMFESVEPHSTAAAQRYTHDGCPIVPLQDPRADLELVLKIIYEPFTAPALWKGLNVDQIIALHRFGTKYQCDAMTQAVVGRLHSEFPCKLDDFLAIYTSHLTHKGEEACKCGTLACAPEFLIKIINYAMDNDLRAILAVACFLASDLSILAIVSGVPTLGGSVITLSPQSQKMLLTGQRSLQTNIIAHAFTWIKSGTPPVPVRYYCSDADSCKCRFERQERKAISSLVSQLETIWRAILVEIDRGSWAQHSRDEYCRKCSDALVKHYNSSREKIWDGLPGIYGLPPWAELIQ